MYSLSAEPAENTMMYICIRCTVSPPLTAILADTLVTLYDGFDKFLADKWSNEKKGEQMFKRFTCRYCGKTSLGKKDIMIWDYISLSLQVLEHWGYTEGPTTPYLICEQCSEEIKNDEKAT